MAGDKPKEKAKAKANQTPRPRRNGAKRHELMFFGLIFIFTCLSITLNVLDTLYMSDEELAMAGTMKHPVLQHPRLGNLKLLKSVRKRIQDAKSKGKGRQNSHTGKNPTHKQQHKNSTDNLRTPKDEKIADPNRSKNDQSGKEGHKIAGLQCAAHGGPSDEIATKEMVYWSDIPSDASYTSPFLKANNAANKPTQYLTFEPDGGGWNNIRMAMETIVVLAHATGRTLVMPPAQGMYLLRKDRGKQNTDFSFADFFPLEALSKEHAGINIISHDEFLRREAMTGHLKNKTTGKVTFPPNNRTNWDGQDVKPYKEYLRDVIYTPLWKPGSCLAVFPASGDAGDVSNLQAMLEKSLKSKRKQEKYRNHPTAVDADSLSRMTEQLSHRRELCIYDEEMQKEPVLHFMCYHKQHVRLLTHFYTFLYFEDWKQQLWEHRFVRDHLRYLDELQCAAARVVTEIRRIAAEEDKGSNSAGLFDTVHIRRGDFQYKDTRLEADQLLEKSRDVLHEGGILYIATDERKKEFFDVFKTHYKVYFLDDFKHLFEGLNTNYYGMLDQLIASRGRTFVGTFHSTFTGYINRMRGYHSQKNKMEGYELGQIDSYYFVPDSKKLDMKKYEAVKGPFFAREFPFSWRDIDKGIGELD